MELKADALLLRAVDYGENDKMVTLLTAQRGKISAGMKGVKKAGAKLRFAAQPFCFAEYVLAERGGRYTVTGASLYDGFYALREDVGAFYAAASVTEACDKLMYEGMVNGELLISAIKALRDICSGGQPFALVRFLCEALSLAGYPLEAGDCPVCGKKLLGRMAFDMNAGAFVCADCEKGVPASESTYRAIRAALGLDGGEGGLDGQIRALRLLNAYFDLKTDSKLTALTEYLQTL